MDYTKYKSSRDLSWKILIQNNISRLPVKISAICHTMGFKTISYKQIPHATIARLGLSERMRYNDGFTFERAIFYNDKCSIARQRFTIAHELGHCLMHNGRELYNREPSENDDPLECEANVFASRVLAPACVLWGIGVTSAEEISHLCNISLQSAEFRFERMKELYARERSFLARRGRSCFLLSPLEQQVYNQFQQYISEYTEL